MANLYAFLPMIVAILYTIAMISEAVEEWRRAHRRKAE
jgi:hypothetical protein